MHINMSNRGQNKLSLKSPPHTHTQSLIALFWLSVQKTYKLPTIFSWDAGRSDWRKSMRDRKEARIQSLNHKELFAVNNSKCPTDDTCWLPSCKNSTPSGRHGRNFTLRTNSWRYEIFHCSLRGNQWRNLRSFQNEWKKPASLTCTVSSQQLPVM